MLDDSDRDPSICDTEVTEVAESLCFDITLHGNIVAQCVFSDNAALQPAEQELLQKMFAAIKMQISKANSLKSQYRVIQIGDNQDLPHPKAILADANLKRSAWAFLQDFAKSI